MKKTLFIFALCCWNLTVLSQDFRITFTATGASQEIDSIKATNLATGRSVTLPGNETLILSPGSGISSDPDLVGKCFAYPNPCSGRSTFTTFINQAQTVSLSVRNYSGQVVADYQGLIQTGQQDFAISLATAGVYFVSVLTDSGIHSQKIICTETGNQANSIEYLGTSSDNHNNHNIQNYPDNPVDPDLKTQPTGYVLGFTPGDRVQFRCHSGNCTTIRTDSPIGSTIYPIEFVVCVDRDGNSYPIIMIGKQNWMAENLKTTRLNDGRAIPCVTDNSDWRNLQTPGYCWPGNDPVNKDTYGGLYNGYAFSLGSLAPAGWNIPTANDWIILANYSGGESVAGNELKETGFIGYYAGQRLNLGFFNHFDDAGNFWALTEGGWNPADLYFVSILKNRDELTWSSHPKTAGHSVRCVVASESYYPEFMNDGWKVSTPQEQGVSTEVLDRAYKDAKQFDNFYSLLVVKNGFLVAEKYFNGQSVSDASSIASVTKSVVSAMAGIAIEKKYLSSTEQKLKSFFPEIDWNSTDPRKSDITIEQVLQMRSGYPWEEHYGYIDDLRSSSNWLHFLKDFPLTSDPGSEFGYSNFTAHMMGIIISRSAGESLLSLLRSYLFDDMGISVPFWPADALGYYYGSGDIFMTARSLAKFGQLYLDNGVWNNVQYIPSEWVGKSLQIHSPTTYGREILSHIHNLGYGYLWWSGTSGNHDIRFAWGHGGQLVVIVKDLNMVVVSTATIPPGVDNEAWQKTKQVMEVVGWLIEQL